MSTTNICYVIHTHSGFSLGGKVLASVLVLKVRSRLKPCSQTLWSRSWSRNISLRFNGHFPGEPGLAGVYWSKEWWRWWWQLDYWSYKSCTAPVKSSPPTNQHPELAMSVLVNIPCLSVCMRVWVYRVISPGSVRYHIVCLFWATFFIDFYHAYNLYTLYSLKEFWYFVRFSSRFIAYIGCDCP